MGIKKCKNCMCITEYVNGTCMKCGFKEGAIPTYERIAMENIAKEQSVKEQVAREQLTREQRSDYSASAMRSNIGDVWYVIAFWLPLVGCQFAAAMLCRGEEREAEALLRTAIKGMLMCAGVIVLLMLIAIFIVVAVGVELWGWG